MFICKFVKKHNFYRFSSFLGEQLFDSNLQALILKIFKISTTSL